MTRFARAKGSKSSNERLPENATSWTDMKQQLLEKKQQIEETKSRQVANKERENNYKSFLDDVEKDKLKKTKWAEFEPIMKNQPEEAPVKTGKKKLLKLVQNKDEAAAIKAAVEIKEKPEEVPKPEGENGNKKRKRNEPNLKNAKKAKKAPLKRKELSEMTEEELKKVEKKKEKRLKQLERKKLKKQNEKLNRANAATETEGSTPNEQPIEPPQAAPKKRKEKAAKPERRKAPQAKFIMNGTEVDIAYIDGFPIKKEDAERIQQLRKQMISKGLPKNEVKIALKLERRKAEKAFSREKKKVCFNCRKSGHNLSECPELGEKGLTETAGTGICFKCGSTEHTHFECRVVRAQEFKFAQCFICKEQGHIARQCPDNARGLYPNGGSCNVCGDVTHLKKDCPKYQFQQEQDNIQLGTLDGSNPDNLDGTEEPSNVVNKWNKVNKIVKF